jgi:phenylalanyl-tRNA synthetase alpha chain
MNVKELTQGLHPLEVKLLLSFDASTDITPGVLDSKLGYNVGQSNQVLSWLSGKGLVEETSRESSVYYELTELGQEQAKSGTPEERILKTVEAEGALSLPELAQKLGLENKDVGSAYGKLAKEGALKMDDEKRVVSAGGTASSVEVVRRLIDRAAESGVLAAEELSSDEKKAIAAISKKRGAASTTFREVEREVVTFRMTEAGVEAKKALKEAGVSGEEEGGLTAQMLRDGSWRDKAFRRFTINVPPSRQLLGRRNPYSLFLEHVKDSLVGLGFEEFDGPLVETEFWNSDALFMPQFHSARDIHDVYYIDQPSHARELPEPYLSQVAATHEDGWRTESKGWRYGFDRDFTRRLILRSQGTVMSAKTLPEAEVPGKYFGILRCFRHDQVDATHLSDFYQTEGIVLGEDVNLETLLGFLRIFAEEIAGATDIRYVPGYFPFTEPSVEVHIKHPILGWFELGGSGIFRPEVTQPLGVEVPVLAWGLGIDRMALMHLGLDDLRELFSQDLEAVRLRRGA